MVEVDFCLAGGLDLPFAPRHAFTGSLELDGATIGKTVQAVNRQKAGKRLVRAVEQVAGWFTLQHGQRFVFVDTDGKHVRRLSVGGTLAKGRICE